jgi:hypothetical protein
MVKREGTGSKATSECQPEEVRPFSLRVSKRCQYKRRSKERKKRKKDALERDLPTGLVGLRRDLTEGKTVLGELLGGVTVQKVEVSSRNRRRRNVGENDDEHVERRVLRLASEFSETKSEGGEVLRDCTTLKAVI